ncbi:MAG: TlpA family protein disulfide reductase [Enterocloster sp.]
MRPMMDGGMTPLSYWEWQDRDMEMKRSEEGIKEFLDENGYTYPVLMDTTGELFSAYGIYSYPTTFMIDRDGNVFGYASGQLNEDMMKNIIEQTMEGKRR